MEDAIGLRIKQLREKKELTQQQLADTCGISLSHMSCIERGKRIASTILLIKLANELGVTLDYLVNGQSSSYVKQAVEEFEQLIKNFSKEDIDQILAFIKVYKPR